MLINSLQADAAYAVRRLKDAPAFTLAATAILALGIGVNTAFFSVVNAVVLEGYAVHSIETLVSITTVTENGINPNRGITQTRFQALEDSDVRTLTGLFMVRNIRGAVTAGDATEVVIAEAASGHYFPALRVRAVLGRVLGPQDDSLESGRTAVISHRLWRRAYGSDPAVIGRSIRLSGVPLTIVGVAPADFAGTTMPNLITTDVWLSLSAAGRLALGSDGELIGRAFARLAPGVAREQADAEVRSLSTRIDAARPDVYLAVIAAAKALAPSQMVTLQSIASVALIVLAGLVLLIACANLSTLLLARASRRATEVGVRIAIGASHGRIFQMQFVETAILAAGGAGIALLVAMGSMQLLGQIQLPELQGVVIRLGARPDLRVLAYSILITLGTMFLIGLAPASRVAHIEPARLWTSAGGTGGVTRHGRRQAGLVCFQIAVSTFLLVAAGLVVHHINQKAAAIATSDPDHLILAHLDPRMQNIPDAAWPRVAGNLLIAAASTPGVTVAALSTSLPSSAPMATVQRVDSPHGQVVSLNSLALSVSPQFFSAMRIAVLRGRKFPDADSIEHPGVVVVNDALAAKLWPEEDPIGKRLRVTEWGSVEVVGVVGSELSSRDLRDRYFVYRPATQAPLQPLVLIVRTAVDARSIVESFKVLMREREPSVSLFDVAAGRVAIGRWAFGMTLIARLLSVVGMLGLVIAVVGLYGVTAYTVSERTQEFGIRRALGASNWHLQTSIVMEAGRTVGWGVAYGVTSAVLLAGFVGARVDGFVALDPLTLVAVSALICSVCMGAAWLAARRASGVEAIVSVRQ